MVREKKMSASNFRLYEISNDYIKAIDSLVIPGELDSIEREKLIEGMKDSFENKCLNVARYIKNLEAEHAAIKQAADDMAERAKRVAKHAESLTEYLRYNIEKTGLCDPIKSPEFDIKLATNPPALVIFDAELIPDLYKIKREVIDIDKKLLKQDIKDGFDVEGCRIEQKKRLVIK